MRGANASFFGEFTFTAMKKRSRESISPPLPDSKRLNHTSGLKPHKKDGVKKPKPNMVSFPWLLIQIFPNMVSFLWLLIQIFVFISLSTKIFCLFSCHFF